jgi:hypothetical protein
MSRIMICIVAIGAIAGCAHTPPSKDCYVESGYLDSTNGCSIRAGYPDCYLVCPDKGTRKHL